MKLKQMPNQRRNCQISWSKSMIRNNVISIFVLSFVTILIGSNLINCHSQTATETPAFVANHTNSSTSRDVTNLHLTSDFRAVNLSWNYKSRGDRDRPASFDVRYCELTSWNVAIKCRHRDLQVISAANGNENITSKAASDLVHHLNAPNGPNYEARIYDLRALTNYTFQVRVSRFEHEQPQLVTTTFAPSSAITSERRQRTQAAARQLALASTGGSGDYETTATSRIETKPFNAEATKCLADVSEVLVNTGRYFGGRISVEDSQDPRCHLIGNKSSEQSSYLFRIDHEICASKLVDGNRIETMVLVHENKDILTHNTARFLVLCNFLQTKSFTLRASVSLPKVNGLTGGGSRPAVITSVPGRYGGSVNSLTALQPNAADGQSASTSLVMLGSMPGIYRARASSNSTSSASDQQAGLADAALVTASTASPQKNQLVDVELETNTIERKSLEKKKELRAALSSSYEPEGLVSMLAAESAPLPETQRQAKELASNNNHDNDNSMPVRHRHSNNSAARSRSISNELSQADSSYAAHVPQPVQVQSKVLFIERGGGSGGFARGSRQHQILDGQFEAEPQQQSQLMTSNHSPRIITASQIETTANNDRLLWSHSHQTSPMPRIAPSATSHHESPAHVTRESRRLQKVEVNKAALNGDELQADLRTTPIIMTNNHRVTGDYLPVSLAASQAATAATAAKSAPTGTSAFNVAGDNYSIKYSAAKVDEIPFASASDMPLVELANQLGRSRIGRMQRMKTEVTSTDGTLSPPHSLTPPPPFSSQNLSPSTTSVHLAPMNDAALSPISMVSDFDVTNPPSSSLKPVWSVNRMGELLAEGGDLASAETSNETQVADQIDGLNNKPSLAANITGALLRWSLKTLGNLAKVSLETLAESTFNSTNINANETQDLLFSTETPVESSASQIEQRTQMMATTTTSSTKRPLLVTSIVQQPTKSSARDRQAPMKTGNNDNQAVATAAVKASTASHANHSIDLKISESESGFKKDKDEMNSDGFITDRKHHSTRPNNYSKSLDLNRVNLSDQSMRQKISEKNGTRLSEQQQQYHSTSAESSPKAITKSHHRANRPYSLNHHSSSEAANSSGSDNRLQVDDLTFYSNWMFYGMALLVMLVTGIVLVLYLLDMTPLSTGSSGPGAMLGGQINCSAVRSASEFDSSAGQSVNSVAAYESVLTKQQESPSYQRYDYNKFENYPTMNGNRLHLAQSGHLQQSDSCSSGSSSSTITAGHFTGPSTTGSQSSIDGTALMAENALAEIVLINTTSKFGNESYA